jgi:hypothetical protein
MLELLTLELGLSDGSTSCIETTFFAQKLSQAYSDPDSYHTARGFRWLRRLGGSFATKNRSHLGSIANKNKDHWFTLTIDCEKEAIGYGDGFRGTPSAGLRKALDWWIFEHLGVVFKSYRIRAASSRTSTWHIGSIMSDSRFPNVLLPPWRTRGSKCFCAFLSATRERSVNNLQAVTSVKICKCAEGAIPQSPAMWDQRLYIKYL